MRLPTGEVLTVAAAVADDGPDELMGRAAEAMTAAGCAFTGQIVSAPRGEDLDRWGQAPELEEELVVASQTYLAEQYQADAETWGEIDQKRWDAFYEWVSDQGFADPIEPGAGMTDKFQG